MTFQRVETLTLDGTANPAYIRTGSVIDNINGFAYFGTHDIPARVIKVDLSTFTVVGTLDLAPYSIGVFAAAIDTVNGFAYFVHGDTTATGVQPRIAKVRLSDFSLVDTLSVSNGEYNSRSAVIDVPNGYLYIGLDGASFPGRRVTKIRLSDFTVVGNIDYPSGQGVLRTAEIDSANGYAYFSSHTIPGDVHRIRLSDFNADGTITFPDGEDGSLASVIDTVNGFVYFVTYHEFANPPSKIKKIRLSDFTVVDTLTLSPEDGKLTSGVIDIDNGFAYFASDWPTSTIVKIDLPTFIRVDRITLDPGEGGILGPGLIDDSGFIYFSAATSPIKVVKIDARITTGELNILSTPDMADVWLSPIGEPLENLGENTPYTTILEEGWYDYKLTLTGYLDYTGSVQIMARQRTTLDITLTPLPTTGDVCFLSNPSGASIIIGAIPQPGKVTALSGTTCIPGSTITGLTPGNYTYEITLTGYYAKTGTFDIFAGSLTQIDVGNLIPLPTTGDVCFLSNPSGASIIIGVTPQPGKVTALSGTTCIPGSTITGLTPGNYTYKLTLTGYQDKTGSFDITAGQTTTEDVGTLQIQVVEAGFGGAGMVLMAGLALGIIYAVIRKRKEQE